MYALYAYADVMYCDVISVLFDYSTLLAAFLSSVTHSIPHSRVPGNPGNENGRSRIPGNEKPRPGMKTLNLMDMMHTQCVLGVSWC